MPIAHLPFIALHEAILKLRRHNLSRVRRKAAYGFLLAEHSRSTRVASVLTEIGCETETALEASNEIKHVDTVSDNLINQN